MADTELNAVEELRKAWDKYWAERGCSIEPLQRQEVPRDFLASVKRLLPAVLDRLDALDKFKTYVHQRLDEAGVPADPPDSPHKAEGCRIGGRLDIVLSVYQFGHS